MVLHIGVDILMSLGAMRAGSSVLVWCLFLQGQERTTHKLGQELECVVLVTGSHHFSCREIQQQNRPHLTEEAIMTTHVIWKELLDHSSSSEFILSRLAQLLIYHPGVGVLRAKTIQGAIHTMPKPGPVCWTWSLHIFEENEASTRTRQSFGFVTGEANILAPRPFTTALVEGIIANAAVAPTSMSGKPVSDLIFSSIRSSRLPISIL